MLTMSMRPRLKVDQKIKMKVRLSQVLSNRIQLQILIRRRELAAAVSGTRYEPKGQCPRCRYRLNHLEILKGFLPDPLDITTKCPECETRFKPRLFADVGFTGRADLAYLCPMQTLEQIKGCERMKPKEIKSHSPAVFHSAIVNFGSLKAAFAKLGVEYKLDKKSKWTERVRPFLGELPDTVIAQYVGVSKSTIWRLRKSLGIEAFVYRDVLGDDIN